MPSIFITGTNRGLGLEFARQYAEAGWQVTAACRDPERAMALKALKIEVLRLDVGDSRAIEAIGKQLQGRSFDILLNNAGIYGGHDQQFGHLDEVEWERVFRVNAIGPIKLAEALLPQLLAGGRKTMVFLSSRMGSIADNEGGSYLYRSSKAALNAAVKSLSCDLAPQGVTALLLHPGWVKTDMGGRAAPVEIRDSVAGMRRVIEQVKPGQELRFVDYLGALLPW